MLAPYIFAHHPRRQQRNPTILEHGGAYRFDVNLLQTTFDSDIGSLPVSLFSSSQ